jgi:hypothetical protein
VDGSDAIAVERHRRIPVEALERLLLFEAGLVQAEREGLVVAAIVRVARC